MIWDEVSQEWVTIDSEPGIPKPYQERKLINASYKVPRFIVVEELNPDHNQMHSGKETINLFESVDDGQAYIKDREISFCLVDFAWRSSPLVTSVESIEALVFENAPIDVTDNNYFKSIPHFNSVTAFRSIDDGVDYSDSKKNSILITGKFIWNSVKEK